MCQVHFRRQIGLHIPDRKTVVLMEAGPATFLAIAIEPIDAIVELLS